MHRNARLTAWGRQELVRRVEAGTPPATVARQMNVSRDTVYKWWRRAQADPQGQWWLDRSGLRAPLAGYRKWYVAKKRLRVIYCIEDDVVLVTVVAVGKREGGAVYRVAEAEAERRLRRIS